MIVSDYLTTPLIQALPEVCREPMGAQRAKTNPLQGKRVLVVEDEMLLALDLEEGLRGAGCEVIGPVGRLQKALRLAEVEPVDAAILDVNLAGEPVFPVAQLLSKRDVPFLFATAYAGADDFYPPEVSRVPRLSKPYTISQALGHLRHLVSA